MGTELVGETIGGGISWMRKLTDIRMVSQEGEKIGENSGGGGR